MQSAMTSERFVVPSAKFFSLFVTASTNFLVSSSWPMLDFDFSSTLNVT